MSGRRESEGLEGEGERHTFEVGGFPSNLSLASSVVPVLRAALHHPLAVLYCIVRVRACHRKEIVLVSSKYRTLTHQYNGLLYPFDQTVR